MLNRKWVGAQVGVIDIIRHAGNFLSNLEGVNIIQVIDKCGNNGR